ncbi:MAG: hypothetical protein QOF82_1938, partial [Frankiales bacterium]|nr:hypothetical protein [Frankiales bacterium]
MNLYQRLTARRITTPIAVVAVVTAMLPVLAAAPARADNPSLHVNFQPAGAVPAGYTADTGVAYNGTSGWQDTSGNPISMTGNTRIRNSSASPDARYDTFLIMQLLPTSSGNPTPGRYVAALPNGSYDVTVGVGDVAATNSVDEITAQPGTADATTIIDHYVPTAASPFATATKRVTVSNGQLILDATGGSQTKIDFLDAVPAAADTTAPVTHLTLSGAQTGGTGSTYVGAVTVTASATDNVGVTATSYTIDGGASTPYTAPFKVSSVGAHTVVVTATDAAGNPGPATATFTIASLLPTSVHTNFQPAGTVPAGYTADTGKPFNGTTGWTDVNGNPLDMTANTRIRNSANSPDARYDTLLIMQGQSGQLTPGRWTTPLNNGSYDVTVGVGDATATNSVYEVIAEPGTPDATTIIDHVVPTAAKLFTTMTKRVTVSGGTLVLDATGGTQTKIDFVDAVPAAADTTAPAVTTSLAGTLSAGAGSPYVGAVTISTSATDNVGVTSISYTLDGGAATPYTVPFKVSTVADHTVVVSASDAAGNVGTATSTFTVGSLLPTSVHTNFQPAGPVPAGYSADTGKAFDGTTGWTDVNGNPLDMTANTRIRNAASSPDARYDTFVIMQAMSGQLTPGRWTTALNNGSYDVTVGVGDATAINSVYEVTAEPGTANATTIIDHYTPTAAAPWTTVTKRVTVSNGTLVLDATGGTQTKIDFVTAVPSAADTLAPVASVSLAGSLSAGAGSAYVGAVTVSASATDNVGVTGISYTVDGGAATPYTVPFKVATVGSHTVVLTAVDAAGNAGTTSTTFSLASLSPISLHVNFAAQTSATPAGYTNDYGQAWTDAAGQGWESASDGTPTSLVGNGRERNLAASPDKRYDTMIQMQQTASSSGGTQTPGQWEHALTNGDYLVTVAVGDASAINSVDRITVEPGTPNAAVLINNFVPTAGSYFATVTQRVTVSDGKLTLNATGGSNTKIDFIDAVPAAPDTTAPTAAVSLAGYVVSPGVYGGNVVATVTAADEAGGSGVTSVTYSLDGAVTKAYTAPVKVTALGSHTMTVTASDKSGNVSITTSTWTQQVANLPQLVVTSVDSVTLHQAAPRLVFSAVNGFDQAPVRYFTFSNTGTQPLTVSGLHFAGTNASSYELADGQAASLTIPAGGSSQVGVRFHPTVPTNCPTSAALYSIGNINQDATLVYTTNDPLNPTGSNAVSGVNSCYDGGDAEPVLDQIIQGLGYSTIVDSPGTDRRFIPQARYLPSTDEIQSPYFVAADATKPVQVTALGHYSGPSGAPNEPVGWYNQGAAMSSSSTCNTSCKQLFIFPRDPSSTNLGESEKLLPIPTGSVNGVTTFNPTGVFGLYGGLGGDSSFTDDGLNWGNVTPRIYEHNIRVFLAYDVNRVLIPNTYILADDPGRSPGGKNNDYQDVVFLVSNAAPAVAQGPLIGAATTTDLTKGGTVGAGCAVSGFDGVLANTGGTQCNPANIAFTGAGLSLTSTAGQLTANTQQNALYKSFDATRGQFTVDAKVVGPITTLTSGTQQIGAWFGPDQNNWVKVQADHTGTGENITMTYREKGTSSTVATVAVPGLATASSVDLVIVGNTSVPDPATGSAHNFPLDEVTVFYRLNGGPLVQVGTIKYP